MPQNKQPSSDGVASLAKPMSAWKVWLPPLLILCAAASLALASFLGHLRAQDDVFEHEAKRLEAGITQRLRDYEFLLRGGLGLLNNTRDISGRQWRAYAKSLDYALFFPDALGLGFSPRVPGSRLAEHMRGRGAETPGYAVYPPGARGEYFPLIFLEPGTARSKHVIGFDLASEPVRRAAVERARDTGEASLTGKLALTGSDRENAQPSCLLLVPVYRQGAPTATVAERRAALRGILSTPFRIKGLVSGILGPNVSDFGVSIYDGLAARPEALLFRAPSSVQSKAAHTAVLDLYGQKWTLVFSWPRTSLLAPQQRESLMLLLLGIILATAVLLIVRNIAVTRAQAERQALYRAMFENNCAMCLLVNPTNGRIVDANRAAAAFYGYTRQELQNMAVGDLNTLPQNEIAAAMAKAQAHGGMFDFLHCLRDGSLRNVRVHSGLFDRGREPLLLSTLQDITDQARAEAALSESRERFRHLFDNAPIPYQSLDENGVLLLVNAAWLDMLGYKTEEVLGRAFAEFLHPDSLPLFRERFSQFKTQGVVDGVEYRLLSKNGGAHLVSLNGRVARDAQGRLLNTHCTFTDITERRAAEEQLAKSHRFLQTLIDNLPIPFVCKDAQGRYLMVNETFASLFAVDKADVLGRTLRDFGSEECARQHSARDQELLAREEDGSLQYEVDVTPPGQEGRHWLVFKSRLSLPDGGFGLVSITLDITERKQAEEALREERRRLTDVIEGTNTGTWEWNIITGEILCNERWARIVGLESEDEPRLTRALWTELTHPDDVPRINAAMARHNSGESQFFDAEYRVRHKAGHWVWVHARGRVFHAASDGSPLLMSGTLSDISQRKLDEERLAMVARFPMENPHPVLRADAQGVLLYANPSAEPLLASWAQKVGGKLPPELRHELRQALDSGQVRTSERSYASGVYTVTVSPFGDKGYVNIYAVNETQRKAAEMALRLSELRYRELAVLLRLMCDNVPDMIWAKDLENRYLFANKAMCEQLLGLDDPDLPLGKTEQFFAAREQAAHPDDPNWHTVWEACVRSDAETLKGVGRGQYEEAGYCRGQFKHYDVRKVPFINDQGAVIGTVGTARDITARKTDEQALTRSEERFRTLAQISPVGIFQADAKGRCTYVNDQWSRISGYPKASALGFCWLRTLNSADRPGVLRSFRETARTGNDCVIEFRFRAQENHGNWVLVRAAAEWDQQGRFIGFVGAVTDISELKRAEVALRQAKAEAEAATEAKALFLANMSHEIRTPLAGVIGTTRLLAQSRLDETQRQLAEMAADSGRALLDVVNDILDFSKIEAGRLTLRNAPFPLRHTVASITGPLALLARERNLFLAVDVAESIPDALVGDEVRLGQVLRNLLTNALKFTETGGITLSVRLTKCAESKAHFVFSVTDTGIGIDPDYLPHLFDSFSQGDSSYGKQHGGTGLGLAICKSLVEQMGGLIQVQSGLGKGSTFAVTVPFCLDARLNELREQTPKIPAAAAAASPRPASPETSGALHVLLADDNAIGRVLMEHVLRDAGYQVSSVADGQEVLRALRAERFDLVLMDVQMPRMDGLTATRQIRLGAAGRENNGIAVVALTAYTSREDRRNFFDAGMDDAVSKPAEDEPLFAAIKRALAVAQARTQAKAAFVPETARDSAPGDALDGPVRQDEE